MVANSGTQNSSIAGDPSPANVFGEVKHASANSGSARCRSAQCTARRIISTSSRSAAFLWSRTARSSSAGVSGSTGAVVDDMAPANQGPPTLRPPTRAVLTGMWTRLSRTFRPAAAGFETGARAPSSTSGRAWFRDRRQGAFLNQRAATRPPDQRAVVSRRRQGAFLNQREAWAPSSTSGRGEVAFLNHAPGPQAVATRSSRCEITAETPSPRMVTPYSASPTSMVRFWCVITSSWEFSRSSS